MSLASWLVHHSDVGCLAVCNVFHMLQLERPPWKINQLTGVPVFVQACWLRRLEGHDMVESLWLHSAWNATEVFAPQQTVAAKHLQNAIRYVLNACTVQ